jgi:hypothetical protein
VFRIENQALVGSHSGAIHPITEIHQRLKILTSHSIDEPITNSNRAFRISDLQMLHYSTIEESNQIIQVGFFYWLIFIMVCYKQSYFTSIQ